MGGRARPGPRGRPDGGAVLNTWLYVQRHDEHDDQAGPPCWLPLADTLPASVGPFARPADGRGTTGADRHEKRA